MENYLVSARKYRPATFDSVIGQQALTTTLKNAISTGKLAHAYLFCGPRGVGKTTCARIFAKTINCMNLTPDGEACNECESCRAFNEQRSYNIHELDAASNNSVDDIRQLVEQVRIPPQIGRYKVYIIDEVHMLSTSAFNAFLKTLEEPPQHAIFILATTEKHKILPTILSRCQIYDFNRIGVEDIVQHLTHVAVQEHITAEPEALNVIALKADGGMRDALSIFDQVVSFTRGNITYQSVIENLNVLDYEYYFRLTSLLLAHKISDCLLLFNEILNKGFDGSHFINGLASHFRDLLVSKDASTLPLLEVGAGIRSKYQEQAQACPLPFLYQALKLSNDCDLNYRASRNKRLLVELTLIQIAQLSAGNDAPQQRSAQTAGPINPIFSTTTQSAQPPRTTRPAQPVDRQTHTGTQTTSTAQPHEPAQSHTGPSAQEAPHSGILNLQNNEKKIPVVKKPNLGVSIKLAQRKESAQQDGNSPAGTADASDTPPTDAPLNEDDVNQCWQAYASQLPKEQIVLAKRMLNMHVALNDDANLEITVENELVANDFQTQKSSIEHFLRTHLHNRQVTLNVNILPPTAEKKIYGRAEKFQLMSQKNNALLDLQKRFGLEFY